MAGGSGKVPYNSQLLRKKWMREGLIQRAATSFFAAYKGTSKDAIIMQANNENSGAGHPVVFDMDGNLAGKPVKGNTTAQGKGELKRKFSDSITVEKYRYVVDNGTKFDGVEIGDLSINEHSDSRSKVADLWVRSSDQSVYDVAQQGAEFGISLGSTFTFDQFLDIEQVVKQGRGFDTTPSGITIRRPLDPYYMADGRPIWLMLVDVAMKNKLLKSTGAQNMFKDADLRGFQNRLFSGVIGKIGNFVIAEAGDFFGSTTGSIVDANYYYQFENTAVEIPGLRQYDTVNAKWTGQEGFDGASTLKSRGVILGAGAIQSAMGKMPDYRYETTDFENKSESCMEIWTGVKPTRLLAENSDYDKAKVAGYNSGLIFVDIAL